MLSPSVRSKFPYADESPSPDRSTPRRKRSEASSIHSKTPSKAPSHGKSTSRRKRSEGSIRSKAPSKAPSPGKSTPRRTGSETSIRSKALLKPPADGQHRDLPPVAADSASTSFGPTLQLPPSAQRRSTDNQIVHSSSHSDGSSTSIPRSTGSEVSTQLTTNSKAPTDVKPKDLSPIAASCKTISFDSTLYRPASAQHNTMDSQRGRQSSRSIRSTGSTESIRSHEPNRGRSPSVASDRSGGSTSSFRRNLFYIRCVFRYKFGHRPRGGEDSATRTWGEYKEKAREEYDSRKKGERQKASRKKALKENRARQKARLRSKKGSESSSSDRQQRRLSDDHEPTRPMYYSTRS